MLGVVVVAGVAGNRSGDASSGSTPGSSTSVSGTVVDGTSGDTNANPGAVDVSLTAPGVTQANVVVESTAAPIQKTTFSSTISAGSYGEDVKKLQQRLTELGFAPGPIDGIYGAGTQQAVWAYKKLVLGWTWQQLDQSDEKSRITPEMWLAMQDPIAIRPRRPQRGGTHVEIYLPQQTMAVFEDNLPKLVTHIASGDGKEWCEILEYDTDEYGQPLEEKRISDECGRSYTPGGVFKFYRRYEGNRVGALGGMYNPVYFNYGIAVHGAQNVPTHPASHGCIRINMDLAETFPSLVENGDLVFVWGENGKEPEYNSKREQTPIFNWRNPNSTTTTSSTTTTTTTTTTIASSTTASTTPPVTTAKPAATTPPATTAAPSATQPPPTTGAPVVTTAAPTPTEAPPTP